MRVEPFRPFHVELLRAQGVQGAQLAEVSHVPLSYATLLEGTGVTAFEGTRVLICGGIVTLTPDFGMCWALLSETASKHMTELHYATKRFITMHRWRRLEASIEKGFPAGCRWAELLGFTYEGEMRGFGPKGETHLRYARVRI